jgi:tripartite-type tricarboxylate transporter receptor subunit TctC
VPADVVATLHQAFRAAMLEPGFIAELAKYDQEPAYLPPDDYGRALRTAYEHERVVVERLGLAGKVD